MNALEDLYYGTKPVELRFRTKGTKRVYFCRNNSTLHLSESVLVNGTYEAGEFLSGLCHEHCLPHRSATEQPCPAFVAKHMVGVEDNMLAPVTTHASGWRLDLCLGFQKLLSIPETEEERFLLQAYYEVCIGHESKWRQEIIAQWNEHWQAVRDAFPETRRDTFDSAMWDTLRFPALIPQVWLNWLYATSEADQKILDEHISRPDFVAFARDKRFVVEVDGPSHYADYDGSSCKIDERAYAKNLKVTRTLEADGWILRRLGRSEVREAMDAEDDFDKLIKKLALVKILPFHTRMYADTLSLSILGLGDIEQAISEAADNVDIDIPF